MKLKFLLPLLIFVAIAGVLWKGLSLDPSAVPSPLVGKPAPQFVLSQLHQADQTINRDSNLGKVWLLNVWASWCVSCRQEHPLFMQLARMGEVPIYGLNYKDERQDAIKWLADLGNPYVISAHDYSGRVGVDYGVYGVPETYVIDKLGVIRYKHTGPVSAQALQDTILPLVRELKKG